MAVVKHRMHCQRNHANRRRSRDDDPEPPDPGFDPHTRGPDGGRHLGLALSALVALIGLGTVGSAIWAQPGRATALAIAGLGVVVATAGGYNTVRRSIDIRPSITADVASVCCGLSLVLTALTLDTATPVFLGVLGGGALVAALAGYNGYRTRENRRISRETRVKP